MRNEALPQTDESYAADGTTFAGQMCDPNVYLFVGQRVWTVAYRDLACRHFQCVEPKKRFFIGEVASSNLAAILSHGQANVRLAVAALRDETGIGLGVAKAERLGQRLADPPHGPWRDYLELSTRAPELLKGHAIPLTLACDPIEGPDTLPTACETSA